MDLLNQLNILGDRVNSAHDRINSGGCCVFAVLVAKELIKRRIRARIIVGGYCPDVNLQEVRMKIKDPGDYREWHDNDVYFAHVGVEFVYKGNVYHYDTNGVRPAGSTLERWRVHNGRMRISWAARLADRPEAWNYCFDRNEIPEIEATVKAQIDNVYPGLF